MSLCVREGGQRSHVALTINLVPGEAQSTSDRVRLQNVWKNMQRMCENITARVLKSVKKNYNYSACVKKKLQRACVKTFTAQVWKIFTVHVWKLFTTLYTKGGLGRVGKTNHARVSLLKRMIVTVCHGLLYRRFCCCIVSIRTWFLIYFILYLPRTHRVARKKNPFSGRTARIL